MSNNFFKVKNGLNLPTLPFDPTVTPPANSAVGDIAIWNSEVYVRTVSAWEKMPAGPVTTSEIAAGAVTNNEVSNTAAIAGTKISPDFGSQNVTTSGTISTTGVGGVTSAGVLRTNSQLQVYASGATEGVYIQQLGSGNALVIEDSANVDSTSVVVDNAGNLGVGVSPGGSLTEKLTVAGDVKVTTGDIKLDSARGIESHTAASTLNIGTGTNTTTLNLGTGNSTQTVNIGTGAGVTQINIGGAGDSVVVAGTLTTVNTINLDVADKNITLNKGGLAGSANGSGISIEAGGSSVASFSFDQIDGGSQPQNTFTLNSTGAVTIPVGTTLQRPNTPVKGMIRYNDSDDVFEGYNELSGWSSIGGGGASERVSQTGLGVTVNFPVGTPLYVDASLGWQKAQADTAAKAEVAGILGKRIDDNTVEVVLAGEIVGVATALFENPASLPARGETVFLSPTTAGKLTATEPTVVGQVSKPVGIVHSVNAGVSVDIMFFNMRGTVVGAANARTTISIANNTASNVVSVVDYNSLKLEGELNVTRSSGGNQRAYYTVEAAKNGAGVWQVSASYTGDDVLYTTLPSWDVASNNLQVTMPLVTNFSSASLTYALGAPAVGASLPLAIDSSALNIVADAPLSYRNRIINGDMRIDQRNAGASVAALNAYTVDRWAALNSTAPSFTIQQNAGAITPPAGFTNYLGCTVVSPVTPGAGQRWSIQQSIEGFNTADLAWGTANAQSITFSFWVRSSLTGVFGGAIRNSAGNRAYPFTYSISAANTWEQKTVTVAGDTTGTWLTNNGIGLALVFSLGAGSTLSGTAGAWAGSDLWSATGSTNVIATNGATFYLTGVQLEVGSKASAFERRPYGMELSMCQRYLPVMNAAGTGKVLAMGQAVGATTAIIVFPFSVTPRVVPTSIQGAITASSYSVSSSTGNNLVSTAVNYVAATNLSAGIINVTVASGLVAGNATYMFGDANIYWLGCEL